MYDVVLGTGAVAGGPVCDYCQRPVVTDSQGRCRNCGAQHVVRAAEKDPRHVYNMADDKWRFGAALGGCVGAETAIAMFKGW